MSVAARAAARRPTTMQAGFTLLELLVVLAILAIVASMSLPHFIRGQDGMNVRAAAAQISDAMRRARGEAIQRGAEVAVTIDLAARTVQVGGQKIRALGDALRLSLYTAQREKIAESAGAIRFYPDGSATGGHVTVDNGSKRGPRARIAVDWLTGRVDVEN